MASRYRASIEREDKRSSSSKIVEYELSPNLRSKSREEGKILSPKSRIESSEKYDIEIIKKRLQAQSRTESSLRSKITDLIEEVRKRKEQFFQQRVQCIELKELLSNERKRHKKDLTEVERELRWDRKKVKTLEETIVYNNTSRLQRNIDILTSNKQLAEANEALETENRRLVNEQTSNALRHEKLIEELENLKRSREGDVIDIQNLENAVKSLHDENQRLKETPIPVVLPEGQPGQKRLGLNLYSYQSERPVYPRVSILDQRAQRNRFDIDLRQNSTMNLLPRDRERWPSFDEIREITWGR